MPEPLVAYCNCWEGEPIALACSFNLTLYVDSQCNTTQCAWYVRGNRGLGEEIIASGNGSGSWAIPIDGVWANYFGTLIFEYNGERSLFMFEKETNSITVYIDITYVCRNVVTGEIVWTGGYIARPSGSLIGECPCTHPSCTGGIGSTWSLSAGSIAFNIICSTPLNGCGCNGISLETSGFSPSPSIDGISVLEWGKQVCATGGTPPYTYSVIEGYLPGGVTLNSDGTFSGSPNGQPGSFYVGVQVTDSLGQTASTTCAQVVCPACISSVSLSFVDIMEMSDDAQIPGIGPDIRVAVGDSFSITDSASSSNVSSDEPSSQYCVGWKQVED
jgi:hypothetical protein